jgi:hypothetical protein
VLYGQEIRNQKTFCVWALAKYIQCPKIFIISKKSEAKSALLLALSQCRVLRLSYVLFLLGFGM